jgi:drug/metabolite transporter (DMT)-like permease
MLELIGFVIAALAIWIIAASPAEEAASSQGTTALALTGGVGFGIYFTALRFANPLGALEPTALARVGSLATCAVLLLLLHLREKDASPVKSSRAFVGWAIGVAVLDTGGNLLYTRATRLGRLDVAAVLASLYPASTILLAAWRLHERPTRRQWLGMGLALVAVVLITL